MIECLLILIILAVVKLLRQQYKKNRVAIWIKLIAMCQF